MTGLIFYGFGMVFLTAWDEFVLPKLQDRGIMPTIPGTLRHERLAKLNKEQRAVPWVTPLTADRALPSLESIEAEAFRVGSSYLGVAQLIMAHPEEQARDPELHMSRPTDGTEFEADEIDGVCRVSPEWSDHFGKRVYICKRPTSGGKLDRMSA
jgi:hypothetical protein